MSTKKETTSNSNTTQHQSWNTDYKFDPTGYKTYQMSQQNLQNQILPNLQKLTGNIYDNPFFNTNFQQNTNAANNLNQRLQQNLANNLKASGMSASDPAAVAMLQRQGRLAASNSANAWLGTVNQAQGDFWNAMNLSTTIAGMNPLVTGQKGTSDGNSSTNSYSVEKSSGLGTWLPQVIGGGMMALGGLGAAGALGSGVKAGMSAGSGFGGFLGSMTGISPSMGSMAGGGGAGGGGGSFFNPSMLNMGGLSMSPSFYNSAYGGYNPSGQSFFNPSMTAGMNPFMAPSSSSGGGYFNPSMLNFR